MFTFTILYRKKIYNNKKVPFGFIWFTKQGNRAENLTNDNLGLSLEIPL